MNPLNIPKKHSWLYFLLALFFIFIVLPIDVPPEVAKLIDTSIGKIVVVVLVINLFMFNPIVGTIAAVAAYELIRRSSGYSSMYTGVNSSFIPSEKIKTVASPHRRRCIPEMMTYSISFQIYYVVAQKVEQQEG